MRHFLPSLIALRAFEASARHGSFTRAADELNVTQTAVSHQIRTLEELIGVRLFIRYRNTLKLTAAAEAYLQSVRSVIALLAQATETVTHAELDTVLTINALATFAIKSLIPRLGTFRTRHPKIRLRISANASLDEFDRKPSDIAIKFGHGTWPGMRVDRLFPQVVYPVCSPALLDGPVPLSSPADLARHTIIRSGFSFLFEDAWPVWLRAAGLGDMPIESPLTFEYSLPAIEAAAEGLGIALGRDPFIDPYVAAGRLICPFDLRVATGSGMFIVSPMETAGRPKVRAFRDWILDEFGHRDA